MPPIIRSAVVIGFVTLISGSIAADERKAPWLWTKDERAQARLEPAKRNARVNTHEAKVARRQGRAAQAVSELADVVDGSENPELYFPTELFRELVLASFIQLPEVYPKVVQQRSTGLFRAAGEWDFFQSVTTEYAQLLQRERHLRILRVGATAADRVKIDQQIRDIRNDQCPAMATALRSLRDRFGQNRFDRMLYEVVPPGHTVTAGGPDASENAQAVTKRVRDLLRVEERCQ